ncbi:ATCNGC3 [Arabidopsis lyrata subsp. lyrata]|uniref:ATCNGC3 n=1 Tax=Arabidopsis lyrata subsp. lyrata TaxID=81972 RepID=D7LEI4_ARALL|nr:probable cyclic nucleotide-gated ion channel 3 [Arabidopsis lyrata subsp. lyrata]EFH56499.1 ATCNGC3 [Arabidopsis lyrata subsp. lyrata]|eukprot:XP_002880240.1 probable cyclic nucleotide-gated ion channel 3 [Arabidopsis lyrata subsp. lyrata]
MMNPQRNKFVRFNGNDEFSTKTTRPSVTSVMKTVRRGFEKGSAKIRTFKQPLSFHSKKNQENKKKKILRVMNPNDSYLQNWNKIFLLLSVVALAFDPLFFYIPVVNPVRFCLNLDTKLEAIACIFRTFIDAFYVVHMLFQFHTGFIAPSSRGFGRGELNENPKEIAIRYLSSYFLVDLLSILPIPQVVVLAIVPRMRVPASLVAKELLKWVIFCQYVPRIARIYPLFKEVTRTSGLVTETAWAGAALNLFLYMLASHVFGSFWYLISIERKDRCWREACAKIVGCSHEKLYCSPTGEDNRQFLNGSCPLIDPEEISNSTVFNFGIFADALQSGVVESRDFPKKFFYCFWWGLRNLSALGQNLKTSTFEGEIIFAIVICVSGLVLFALLIGNMQKYLQSTTVRVEEMRVKRRDAEQWMSHRMLPDDLRKRIRKYEQYKWQETKGVEEEALLSSLPKDLRKDIKRHLCLNLLKKVPWFQAMDDRLLDALCARLKTVLYTENSYIVREGEPVEDMLFIMRGNLISTTTYGGKTGFFNSVRLVAGDFCGDLLTWALDPLSSNFPISSRTVQALTEVEGFVLSADDLKFVATQYRRLHSKQLRHMFRFYSVQWQTWAACFIQAAWKRHCRRKLSKALREEESKLHNTLQNDDSGGNKLNLGAAIYASRFASHALRNLRANAAARNSRFPHMLSLLPQKPADPEFSMDGT